MNGRSGPFAVLLMGVVSAFIKKVKKCKSIQGTPLHQTGPNVAIVLVTIYIFTVFEIRQESATSDKCQMAVHYTVQQIFERRSVQRSRLKS